MKHAKVAYSARAIMQSLWGPKGRPETNAYADRCAEQQQRLRGTKLGSLKVTETVRPSESARTTDKWAAARARHGVKK